MLTKLAQYAEQVGLMAEPGFSRKEAKAAIVINPSGEFLFLEPYDPPRRFEACPDLSQGQLVSGGKTRSHFLLDAFGVVSGTDEKLTDKRKVKKLMDKHKAFLELHNAAAKEVVELAPLAAFLTESTQKEALLAEAKRLKLKATDNVTFRIQGQDLAFPDQACWHGWWKDYCSGLNTGKPTGQKMRCFLSGELVEPALTHAQKIRLQRVGGQPSGSTLIGFDKESFQSYGLVQSANAACSAEAAAVYASALNDLIDKAPRPLANTLMLHWFDRALPREWDPFADDDDENEDNAIRESARAKANRIAMALEEGRHVELTNNSYHVLLLSGSAGRAVARDYFEGDLVSLVESQERWYADLALLGPSGFKEAEPPKLFACLVRLVPYSPYLKPKEVGKMIDDRLGPIIPRLLRSILVQNPLPQVIAIQALRYSQSRLLREKNDESANGRKTLPNLDRIACSLIKAWYNRALAYGQLQGGVSVTVGLNKDHPSSAYQAGRLLAILNRLQHEAIPDVGADVVQRFYSAASISPGLVLGRLISGAQPHLAKLRKDEHTRGLSFWFEQQIAEIISKQGDEVLEQLDFAGQALFALGFYHQMADGKTLTGNQGKGLDGAKSKDSKEVCNNGD